METLDRDRLGLELEVKRLEIRRRVQSAFATVLYSQRVIQGRAEDVQIAENGVAVAKARLAAGDAIPAEVSMKRGTFSGNPHDGKSQAVAKASLASRSRRPYSPPFCR
jgi:hypothetical protein